MGGMRPLYRETAVPDNWGRSAQIDCSAWREPVSTAELLFPKPIGAPGGASRDSFVVEVSKDSAVRI